MFLLLQSVIGETSSGGELLICFRNSDCETRSQSDNTVGNPHRFIINGIEFFEGNEEVTKVIDVENWRLDNSRVLRWIVSLIVWNSSVLSTKSAIQRYGVDEGIDTWLFMNMRLMNEGMDEDIIG
nr:hypothetical protein [Tanacetum cinerariifolium]